MNAIVQLGRVDNPSDCTAPVIVVFPHAGGSPRFYARWASVLTRYRLWGMTYPGRDARQGETPHATLQALAQECAWQLDLHLDKSTSALLIGHSMGAWVAWETARSLEQITPERLLMTVVSGQNPPDYPPVTLLHQQDDSVLIADMNRQNPQNSAIWQHPEMRQLFLPAVRADYRLLETYRAGPGTVADLTVVYGEDDPEIDTSVIQCWRKASRGAFRTLTFPGGHFYLAAPDLPLAHYLRELLPY